MFHGLAHKLLHLLAFFGCDWAGLLAVNQRPDPARADVASDIGGDSLAQKAVEVAAKILPTFRSFCRRGGIAFTENHGGDALADHSLGVTVGQDGVVGVIVNIDESGGDHESVAVIVRVAVPLILPSAAMRPFRMPMSP